MKPDFLTRYGKRALVTGASSGIGEQFARVLAQAGFDLLLVARREELLTQLQKELQQSHRIAVAVVAADLSQPDEVQRVAAAAKAFKVSLVVSNAGFGLKGSFTRHPFDTVQAMVQVNAMAPLILAYELLPWLSQALSREAQASPTRRGGFIVTGSMEGEAAFPWSSAYAATKAFVHSLGNGLWEEYRNQRVDVLVLAPGSTDTNAPVSQGISRDQLVGLMSPHTVAQQALDQLGRTPIYLPGLHNRVFIRVLRWLPRAWALRLAGFGMKQAIEKSGSSLH